MRKFWILLVVFCMLAGSVTAHAAGFEQTETISLGEEKLVTIPEPEGEIDPGVVYFTQTFLFVPEEDGSYCFFVRCEEDPSGPYEIFMDVSGSYRKFENGCSFDGQAGESRELSFQYPTHDGRYPEFAFRVVREDAPQAPAETEPSGLTLPDMQTLLGWAAAAALLAALAALLIAERKQNT